MRIKIHETNRQKIETAIKAVEGKARERLLTYDMMTQAIEDIHKTLKVKHKKDLEGTRVKVSPHVAKFPRAYQYRPNGTYYFMRFDKGNWYLTHISRYHCDEGKQYDFDFSEVTKKALLDYAKSLYS